MLLGETVNLLFAADFPPTDNDALALNVAALFFMALPTVEREVEALKVAIPRLDFDVPTAANVACGDHVAILFFVVADDAPVRDTPVPRLNPVFVDTPGISEMPERKEMGIYYTPIMWGLQQIQPG